MKSEYDVSEAIDSISKKLHSIQELAEYEIMNAVEERDSYADHIAHIRDRIGVIDKLKSLDDALKKIRDHYEVICEQEMGLSLKSFEELADKFVRKYAEPMLDKAKMRLRHLTISLTKGMLSQSLLTFTEWVNNKIIQPHEKFIITFPNGKTIETDLVQPGNRLRSRGPIGKFYREHELKEEDDIEMQETERGKWTLKPGRKIDGKIDDLLKKY